MEIIKMTRKELIQEILKDDLFVLDESKLKYYNKKQCLDLLKMFKQTKRKVD